MTSDPIIVELEVDAPVSRAFQVWTDRCGMWWPPSHTMSQSEDFDVVFEPRVGGRIYEREPDGTEHEWGEITVWDPPHRLEYLWHIFLDREKATNVSVTFTESGSGTVVRLENSGFEVFAEAAAERKPRVETAWTGITGRYRDVVGSST